MCAAARIPFTMCPAATCYAYGHGDRFDHVVNGTHDYVMRARIPFLPTLMRLRDMFLSFRTVSLIYRDNQLR
jgi:hypothetical protein